MSIAELQWASGLSPEEMRTRAGRVEQELNSNGDPLYVGYAPKTDSRTDAHGWILEYYIYGSTNDLLSIHRTMGTWNSRAVDLPATLRLLDMSPAVGTISMAGIASAVIYHTGIAVGSIRINQVYTPYGAGHGGGAGDGIIDEPVGVIIDPYDGTEPTPYGYGTVKIARAIGSIRVNNVTSKTNTARGAIALATVKVLATVRDAPANVVAQIAITANARADGYAPPKAFGTAIMVAGVTGRQLVNGLPTEQSPEGGPLPEV